MTIIILILNSCDIIDRLLLSTVQRVITLISMTTGGTWHSSYSLHAPSTEFRTYFRRYVWSLSCTFCFSGWQLFDLICCSSQFCRLLDEVWTRLLSSAWNSMWNRWRSDLILHRRQIQQQQQRNICNNRIVREVDNIKRLGQYVKKCEKQNKDAARWTRTVDQRKLNPVSNPLWSNP